MKPFDIKAMADKAANVLIVALVVVGTAAFGAANQAPEGGEILSKAFLFFLGAIVTLQVIPGLILLAAMLKGIAGLGRKEKTEGEQK